MANQFADTIKQNLSSTQTPTSRGRGRPKGSLNKNTATAEFKTAETLSTNPQTTTPKSRGRPKGSLNKFKKQNLKNVNEDVLSAIPSFSIIMGGPDQEIKIPRKDGRGRPKAEFDGPGQAGIRRSFQRSEKSR